MSRNQCEADRLTASDTVNTVIGCPLSLQDNPVQIVLGTVYQWKPLFVAEGMSTIIRVTYHHVGYAAHIVVIVPNTSVPMCIVNTSPVEAVDPIRVFAMGMLEPAIVAGVV